jgi:hypothetical protein
MRLHYFILIILVKIWPKLFDRYQNEYGEIFFKYRRKNKMKEDFMKKVKELKIKKEGIWEQAEI